MPPVGDHGSAATPSTEPERWIARDDTTLAIRVIAASDFALEKAFIDGLSQQTAYLRLLSIRKPQPEEIARFTDIDPKREMAWIAVATVDGHDTMCGVARYVRDGDTAEWAIVLTDAWQGRGLGDKLLRKLIASARQAGIAVLSDVTFATNTAMLGLARKLGFALTREARDATLTRMTLRL